MKDLFIGATGRVGTEVVKALLLRGAGVRAFTRKQPKPGAFPDSVEIALGDLSDPVSVTKKIRVFSARQRQSLIRGKYLA